MPPAGLIAGGLTDALGPCPSLLARSAQSIGRGPRGAWGDGPLQRTGWDSSLAEQPSKRCTPLKWVPGVGIGPGFDVA